MLWYSDDSLLPHFEWLSRQVAFPESTENCVNVRIPTADIRLQQTQMYEVASMGSYGTIVILALLSFAGPLLLLYFNQFTDSMQSLLVAVFDEVRACRGQGVSSEGDVCVGGPRQEVRSDIVVKLNGLNDKCFELIKDAHKAGDFLRPIFSAVVFNSIGLLLLQIFFQMFVVRSICSYSFIVRIFNSSIWLGVVSIFAFGYLTWHGLPSRRVELLEELAKAIHPSKSGESGETNE